MHWSRFNIATRQCPSDRQMVETW